MLQNCRFTTLLLLFMALPALLFAQDDLPQYGVETKSSDYFKQRYQYNDLVHYLDNLDLYVTYQAETTGQFNQADRMIFSIEGSSYRWNSYYLDGFRIDSRYFSGSTLYTPDMYDTSLSMDYIGTNLFFEQQRQAAPSISGSFNVGGLGGISSGTAWLINLFHRTASERAYLPIEDRNKVAGAGTLSSTFIVEHDGEKYYHNQYINYGVREVVDFDHEGISGYYPEDYFKAQLSGDMPWQVGGLFDKSHYLVSYSSRSNLNSEFYYSQAESAAYNGYSASLYGTAQRGDTKYSSGVTFAQHNTRHEDINFSRNLYDQDGEAFEPYAPDGNTFELSHAILWEKQLKPWLKLSFDGYNSLLYSAPSTTSFNNVVYTQQITDQEGTPLYVYDWQSSSYASGLLENSLKLSAERELSKSLMLRADAALTLDAMLLGGGKSKVSPNVELQAGVSYNPNKWFSTEVTLARRRVSYTIEDLQYFSNDYLNGDIYYHDGLSASSSIASGNLFTSTGGALHTLSDDAQQPAYYVFDFPVHFTFGRHRFSFLQSARKYVNNWMTSFDGDASDYGHYVTDPDSGMDIYFLNSGATPNYIVGDYPEGIMGDSFLNSTPFYFSSNIQYSYTSPKFQFSFAWQSYMQSGISTLGNGPLHNNLGVLSESTANPNTLINAGNVGSDYMAVGRLDQDRAYVMRMFASYNITEKWDFAATFKFKDGQPFSHFNHFTSTDESGNRQVALFPSTTRGINTMDGDFGTREDAFFNLDLRLTYRTTLAKRPCEMQLNFYNVYDFGTEVTEYMFHQDIEETRNALSLNIPRGMLFTFKYYL